MVETLDYHSPAPRPKPRSAIGAISTIFAITAWISMAIGIHTGINNNLGTPHWAEVALLGTLLGLVSGIISIRSLIGKIGFGMSLASLLVMVFVA